MAETLPDPLGPFDPQVDARGLHLTLRRHSPIAVAAAGGVFATVSLGWFLVLAGAWSLAVVTGIVAVLLFVVSALAIRGGWMSQVTLHLEADALRTDSTQLARADLQRIATQNRVLHLRAQRGRLDVYLLRHQAADLAVLGRVLRAWSSNPAYRPDAPLPAPSIAEDLGTRLAPVRAQVSAEGFEVPLEHRRSTDFLLMGSAFVVAPLAAWFVTPNLAWPVFIVLFMVGLVLGNNLRRRPRGTLVIGQTGVSLHGAWRVPWSEVRAATLPANQNDPRVLLHLVDGTCHELRPVQRTGREALAEVLTDLARPDGSSDEVPANLQHLTRRQDRDRSQEG